MARGMTARLGSRALQTPGLSKCECDRLSAGDRRSPLHWELQPLV